MACSSSPDPDIAMAPRDRAGLSNLYGPGCSMALRSSPGLRCLCPNVTLVLGDKQTTHVNPFFTTLLFQTCPLTNHPLSSFFWCSPTMPVDASGTTDINTDHHSCVRVMDQDMELGTSQAWTSP
ncbi:hypothetical protein STEG23_012238 [Scotinomys teguina]